MIDTPVIWPNGAQCAVLLTFDFDAETLWLGRDPSNINRPGTLSQGAYGAKVAVPSILPILREMGGLPATFFVPGWTAEHHTSRVEAILKDGHEVAHHSYSHKWIEPTDPAGELEEMEKGLESLKRTVGVVPVGYRSPAGETSNNLIKLLVERNFLYDSSMMDTINPYFHAHGANKRALVELPWHWSLDDAVYMVFSIKAPRAIQTNAHVLTIWQDEFRAIYRAGGLFDLVMHPQAIGRPSRLQLLRDMIAFIQGFPNVWFCTCRDAAQAFINQAK
ncbi:MAG: polysaccharide deacetylase [Alphaproteobacteria bacterium]|nr:polysaccharide deacetylase [Alphaproteobacteria bacterium]